MALTVKFKDEVGAPPGLSVEFDAEVEAPEQELHQEAEAAQHVIPFDEGSSPQDEVPKPHVKPLPYVALLERKSDAAKEIQKLLSQVSAERGSMPEHVVYRVRSDMGTEFCNKDVLDSLRFHGIQHTTTQGYDPSSNGTAENGVGLLKKRARYLLRGTRLPTRWCGMAVLAAAQLYRVDAGHGSNPRVPFATRVMVNVDPQPRNAFLPRSLPATIFGPCDNVPPGYWVYQNGRMAAKVNVQTAGLSEEELIVVKAMWDDLETPLAPLPPPDASLFDAAAVTEVASKGTCTLNTATCPACIQMRYKKKSSLPHTQVWGGCFFASPPPAPASAILESDSSPEAAPEDGKPEEKPSQPLVRAAELVEQLHLGPSTGSIVAKADITDAQKSHLHAIIASAVSSAGATRGSGPTTGPDLSDQSTDLGDVHGDGVDLDDDEWVTGTWLQSSSLSADLSSEGEQRHTDDHDPGGDDPAPHLNIHSKNRRRRTPYWIQHREECYRVMDEQLQSDSLDVHMAFKTIIGASGNHQYLPDTDIHCLALSPTSTRQQAPAPEQCRRMKCRPLLRRLPKRGDPPVKMSSTRTLLIEASSRFRLLRSAGPTALPFL